MEIKLMGYKFDDSGENIAIISLQLITDIKEDIRSESFMSRLKVYANNIPSFNKGDALPFRLLRHGFFIDVDLTKKIDDDFIGVDKSVLNNIENLIYIKY